MCMRIAEIAGFTIDRFGDRRRQAESVCDAVRRDQGDRRAAVVQRPHAEVERRAPFGVDGYPRALLDPGADHRTRPALRDVDLGGGAAGHPTMTAEWQRRALDPTPEQPVTETAIEGAQFVDVDVAVVYPRALNHAAMTGGPQPQKRRLVEKRQSRHRHPASAAARYPRTAAARTSRQARRPTRSPATVAIAPARPLRGRASPRWSATSAEAAPPVAARTETSRPDQRRC